MQQMWITVQFQLGLSLAQLSPSLFNPFSSWISESRTPLGGSPYDFKEGPFSNPIYQLLIGENPQI